MGLSPCCSIYYNFSNTIGMVSKLALVVLVFYHFVVINANSLNFSQQQHPSCHDDERSALLQFFNSAAAQYSTCRPADLAETSDCCRWSHILCDNKTSHIIGLDMWKCNFSGLIPSSLGNLRRLKFLDLSLNKFNGAIPIASLENLTQLTTLRLDSNELSGSIPSLGNLRWLKFLSLSGNKFNGAIPIASFENLTQLTALGLGSNEFSGSIPSLLGNLHKLNRLSLSSNHLSGHIPSSLRNLTQLSVLLIDSNQLSGRIPSYLGNFSRLVRLDVSSNNFHGSIPQSLSNLINLFEFDLSNNNLSGRVDFQMFQKLQELKFLVLSFNNLELFTETRIRNETFPQLRYLNLASCNIEEFPSFVLRYQKQLIELDLYGNKMRGQVPKWMFNMSTESLEILNISHNFLSGFDQPPVFLPWVNLLVLDLSSNMLHGPLPSQPLPLPNIRYFRISDNKLTGEIPPTFCTLSFLGYLDLSSNELSGTLPQCLGNFSDELRVLHLGYNSFHGILPQTYTNTSNLKMIDVSHNQLQGQLPRSLGNCLKLEFLVLSNNKFNDVFPFWLGTLPELKLLAMRNSGFHDVIKNLENNHHSFPKLGILDMSQNNFTGEFPSEYIFSGRSMRGINQSQSTYMKARIPFEASEFEYSITMTHKGVERYFQKIHEGFVAIDLSSNKFEGNIPDSIGKLMGLRSINLSNNYLTGRIPRSLGNLTLLESLDLSQNNLSGQIPQQVSQLTFLANFNVSYNNLSGLIPHGPQFTTFDITSYEGNPGLCGDPLPKKCGNAKAPQMPPSRVEENHSGSVRIFGLDLKFVLAGCGSGLVVGVVLADVAITKREDLFLKIVGMINIIIMKWRRPRRERR